MLTCNEFIVILNKLKFSKLKKEKQPLLKDTKVKERL